MLSSITTYISWLGTEFPNWPTAVGLMLDLVGAILLVGTDWLRLEKRLNTHHPYFGKVQDGWEMVQRGNTLTEEDKEFRPLMTALNFDNMQNETKEELESFGPKRVEPIGDDVMPDLKVTVETEVDMGPGRPVPVDTPLKFPYAASLAMLESEYDTWFSRRGVTLLATGFTIQLGALFWNPLLSLV